MPPAADRLLASDRHLQLSGRKGFGKSTLLRLVALKLWDEGCSVEYEYLPPGKHTFDTSIDGLEVFILDEAQRLFPGELLRLLMQIKRHKVRLIYSTHLNLRPLLMLCGLRTDGLHVSRRTYPDPVVHIQQVAETRLAFFALPGAEHATITPEGYDWLHARFGVNMRDILAFLYHVFQRLDDVQRLTDADFIGKGQPSVFEENSQVTWIVVVTLAFLLMVCAIAGIALAFGITEGPLQTPATPVPVPPIALT